MADDITLNQGAGGDTIAADDVAGVKFQRIKIALGADGAHDNDVDSGQQAMAASVPVVIASDQSAVAVSNAGLTELAAAINASSQMDVNLAASAATVAVSNGGLTELAAAINASSQMDVNIAASGVDVMLGTDFSDVLGTASLITATQADNLANTTDTINVSALGYVFDGTTWDRALGNSTDGTLVNLGTNNDVTITSGTVTTVSTVTTVTTVTTVSTVTAVSAVNAVIPGTGATNLGKAEDAGHTSGDTGVFALGVRNDAPITALTTADAEYIQLSTDSAGVQWVRNKEIPSYTASYRLAEAAIDQLSLSIDGTSFTGNTAKQLATIYHTGGSTKTVKIRRIVLNLNASEANIFGFEVRALSSATAPATGAPAITPRMHHPADGAAEATCLAIPGTAGSYVSSDSIVSEHIEIQLPAGSLSAQLVLYDFDAAKHMKPLTMRAGSAEGFAVVCRPNFPRALRFTVSIDFTEE